MTYPLHPLVFGENSAATCKSEASYLDALRNSRRPVRDASFRTRWNVITKASLINVGGITIAAGAGCPVHLETNPDPQYTLLIYANGSGSITQGGKTLRAGPRCIIRSSYQKHLTSDYDHYSGFTIRSSIPLLLDVMKISDDQREKATERLLDTDLEQLPPSVGGIDYYETVRSLLRIIDATDRNADQLQRIGYHKLLTGIIADLTLKVDRRLTDL